MANRRDFLRSILMASVGHMLDVDKMLWVPGAKKIFIPTELLGKDLLDWYRKDLLAFMRDFATLDFHLTWEKFHAEIGGNVVEYKIKDWA